MIDGSINLKIILIHDARWNINSKAKNNLLNKNLPVIDSGMNFGIK